MQPKKENEHITSVKEELRTCYAESVYLFPQFPIERLYITGFTERVQ